MQDLTTRDLLELYVFADSTELQAQAAELLGNYPFS